MLSLSATWSSDPRLRKEDRSTRRYDEPGCPIKGRGRPSSPEMQCGSRFCLCEGSSVAIPLLKRKGGLKLSLPRMHRAGNLMF